MSASSRIIAEAQATTEIVDSKGRKLTLRKLTALDQLRLFRALGATQSENSRIFYMTSAAVSVAKIDGLDMRFPLNERMIDDTIQRLGDDGLAAVMFHQQREIMEIQKAAEAALDANGEEEVEKQDPLVVSDK